MQQNASHTVAICFKSHT